MRIAAQYNPDLTALDAYTASVRSWLADLLAFLLDILARLDPIARQRQRAYSAWQTRSVAHGLRSVLFTRALVALQMRINAPRERVYHRQTTFIRRRAVRRALTSVVVAPCLRGALEDRIAALEHILDNLDAALARTIARARRVLKRLRVTRLVHARPSLAAPRLAHIVAQAATADTS